RLTGLLHRPLGDVDDIGIEGDRCLDAGLPEGGNAREDDVAEEHGDEAERKERRGQTAVSEDRFGPVPATQAAADAVAALGGRIEAGGAGSRGGVHSYCSRKRRTT